MDTVVSAFTHFDSRNPQHLMVIDLRLPRVLISGLIGAALAVAGAIMQGTTRNPMADSGLWGSMQAQVLPLQCALHLCRGLAMAC